MPEPRKRGKGAKATRRYAGELIRHYHHKGYPHRQAIAIGLSKAGVSRKGGKAKKRR